MEKTAPDRHFIGYLPFVYRYNNPVDGNTAA